MASRYNQAAVLAARLARQAGKPCDVRALVWKLPTAGQGEMPSAKARRRNVPNAFLVPREMVPWVKARNILLVDNVFTTGATLDACARAQRGSTH